MIILGGIMSYLNLTYSASGNNEHKYMFDISAVQYFAPGVDITEFQCILIVSIEAVCVVTLPS
jgi:hypothetical protein